VHVLGERSVYATQSSDLVWTFACTSDCARSDRRPADEGDHPGGPGRRVDQCGFPVLDHAEGYTIVESFTDEEGNLVRQIFTAPGVRETLTNLDTGKTIVLNIEGPGSLELNPDGSGSFTGTGPYLFYFHPSMLTPALFYTTGRFVITFDANGDRTSFESVGPIIDVCAELAA
jgi:hypothetical protein